MNKILWKPSQEDIAKSSIARFTGRYTSYSLNDYSNLHQWSIDNPGAFWSSLWDFAKVKGEKGSAPWLVEGKRPQDTKWFPGAKLNFAENLLFPNNNDIAIVCYSEQGERRAISHHSLYLQVARISGFLRKNGIGAGDRVAACLPNSIEAIIAFIATSSIGAIWSSCSPDFGAQAIVDRFAQISPKVIFSVGRYSWKGKEFNISKKINSIVKEIPSIEFIIQVPFSDLDDSLISKNAHQWDDIEGSNIVTFERLPFDHPIFILFSSGTTGAPKCIVHRSGGILLQHLKEHLLHNDFRPNEKVFFYTTCGWMMWNWLVTALASKVSLILYDGSPFYPHATVLLDYMEEEEANFFGTSPPYLSLLEKNKISVIDSHDFSSLRTIASTGSVLTDENFDYVYKNIKEDIQLVSMSGGTDIASCFILANPLLPVIKGQIQSAGLGQQVAVVDKDGKSVIGEKGELVCRNSFPAMPLSFWDDNDGSKYYKSYFKKFKDIWTHGDYALQTPQGGFIIYGRSDSTLNPKGIRIGTAEIYRQVSRVPEVIESVVIGQEWEKDIRIVLFVKLKKGVILTSTLEKNIKRAIMAHTSPRHIPAVILQVEDIPKTRNGKISELAVRDIVHNKPIKNQDSLANPLSIDFFKNIKELQK